MRMRSSQLFSIRQILIKRGYQPVAGFGVVVTRWRDYHRDGFVVELALRNAAPVKFIFPNNTSRSYFSAVELENFSEMLSAAEQESASMSRENNS